MAKYNRAGKVRRGRRWYENVGSPIDLAAKNQPNPNDSPKSKK